MRNILLSLFFLFLSSVTFCQHKELQRKEQIQNLSKEVTNLFMKNNISDAFDELKPYWPLPENEIESIEEKTIKYLNILDARFGKAEDFIKIKEEKISDFSIRETYIIRYDYSAIRLKFTYFRSSKGWIVNSFKWDDSFEEEFE